MASLEFWRDGLWTWVEETHRPGQPIYLCFDALLLERLLVDAGVEVDSPESALRKFHEDCAEIFIRHKRKVTLRPLCFVGRGEQNRTLSVVVAAQQIIAAEMMVSDEIYSADSYYARYRECLGVDPNVGQLPFDYRDFKRVWGTLQSEILSLPGATRKAITFFEGRGSKNKFRNYPISQALLDEESLRRILASREGLEKLDNEQLVFWLKTHSFGLSNRAKQKLKVAALQNAICDQVRTYATGSAPTPPSESKNTNKQEQHLLLPTDVVLERYESGFDTGLRLRLKEDVSDSLRDLAFQRLLAEEKVLSLIPSLMSGWVGAEVSNERLIHEAADFALVPATLDAAELKGAKPMDCIGLPTSMRLFDVTQCENPAREQLQPFQNLRRVRFSGGLCLDQLRTKYLTGYPPTRVWVDEAEVQRGELVLLDGEKVTLKSAIGLMAEATDKTAFDLEVRGKQRVLQFWAVRDINPIRYGYKIDNGTLNVQPTKVLGVGDYFEHFGFNDVRNRVDHRLLLAKSDLISMTRIPPRHWSKATQNDLLSAVEIIGKTDPLRRRLCLLIMTRGAIPGPLRKRLCG